MFSYPHPSEGAPQTLRRLGAWVVMAFWVDLGRGWGVGSDCDGGEENGDDCAIIQGAIG